MGIDIWHSRHYGNRHFGTEDIMGIDHFGTEDTMGIDILAQ